MTVRDFETEQVYMNGKRHLLNRMVSGPGMICGLGLDDVELSVINNNVKISFKTGGAAIDGLGREIVVPVQDTPREIYVKVESEKNPLTAADVEARPYYLYLEYDPREGELVSSALENSSCEETCCPNRIIENFEVIAYEVEPDAPIIACPDFTGEISADSVKQEVKNWLRERTSDLGTTPGEDRVFFLALNQGSSPVTIDKQKTAQYLTFVTNNSAFSELIACHLSDFGNPHKTTAKQVGALVSVDGVADAGGNVDLIEEDSITITPNDDDNTIRFGETHSARKDNPHDTTARQVGALVSVDGVDNPGGGVEFVESDSITITPDNVEKTVTIGETHSARTDNPHNVKMSQLGDFDANNNNILNLKGPVDSLHAANKEYVDTQDAGMRQYVDGKDAAMKEYIDSQDIGDRNYVDGKDAAMKDYVDTQDASMRDYVDTQDTGVRQYVDEKTTASGNPHSTEHAELISIQGYSAPQDPPTSEDDVKDKHISNNDAKKWNEAAERPVGGGELSGEGGMLTGSLYVKTAEWSAISGTATKTHGVMGQLTADIETGSSYRTAGVVGVSEIEGKHGVYAKAPAGTHALYVKGSAHFTGPMNGYTVSTFKNGSTTTFMTGDIVALTGTIARFSGENNKIPVPEVTLVDENNTGMVVGIVDSKAIPEEDIPAVGSGSDVLNQILEGEELYVVTHGCYAHCKVTGAAIEVGDLLTPSPRDPLTFEIGYAMKAVEPIPAGTIIGKALEAWSGAEGEDNYIAVL
jgi:hypothetical protein